MRFGWTHRAAANGPDIEEFWAQDPDANVGVLTGSASGIWVLDVDTDKGGAESFERLTAGRVFQPGVRSHTTGGGGFHLIFTLPAGVHVRTRPLPGHPGIDVKGEGGMVLAPPSVSGKGAYRVDADEENPPGPAPGWLLELVRVDGAPAQAPRNTTEAAAEPVDRDTLPHALAVRLGTGMVEGDDRSRVLHGLILAIKEAGYSEGQAITLIAEWCEFNRYDKALGRVPFLVRLSWGKHRQGLELPPVPGYTAGGPNMSALAFALDPVPTEPAAEAEPGVWAPPRVIPHPELDGKLDEAFPEFDFAGMWEHADDPPEWVWEPFLEREGHITLYSEAKQGKSLLVLEAVAALCSGQLPPGATVAQAPKHVAYVDRENPRKAIVKRLRAMGFKPDQFLPYLHYYRYPQVPPLDSAEGGMLFVRQMMRIGVELVVIDTTSKFIGGDEDKADTINALDRHTIQPLTRNGISVLRLDHAGKDTTRGQRGSSAKAAIGDGAYRLTRRADWIHLKGELRNDDSPEEFLFIRRREPLRHDAATEEEKESYEAQMNDDGKPDGEGGKQTSRPRKSNHEKLADVVAKLDACGVPVGARWREAEAQMKAAGITFNRNYLAKALDLRVDRAEQSGS